MAQHVELSLRVINLICFFQFMALSVCMSRNLMLLSHFFVTICVLFLIVNSVKFVDQNLEFVAQFV
jgi:hypothetical protein